MKQWRRLVWPLMAGVVVAACGGSDESGDDGGTSDGDGESVTLEYWSRGANEAINQALVDAFNSTHDTQVELLAVPDDEYVTKLAAAVSSGTAPDVVTLDIIAVPELIGGNALEDITDRAQGLEFYDELAQGYLNESTDDAGRVFALPENIDASALFWNKGLFEQAGLDPESPPTSHAEVLEYARAIDALGDDTHGFYFAGQCTGCNSYTFQPLMWASDGDWVSEDGTTATVDTGTRVPVGLLVGLGLLGLLLTTAARQVPQDADLVSAERNVIIEDINEESERSAELEQTISELQDEVVTLQDRQLESVVAGTELGETMRHTQAALGLDRVTGPGVIIELHDADPGADGELKAIERVLDKDLAMVVNGLWAAGAEAISIDGERITPLSAIRRVEDVILVNYQPVAPPYEVRAIGDPRTLGPDFAAGSGGAWLRTANAHGGIQSHITNSESLTLPSGSAPLDYAEVKETQ